MKITVSPKQQKALQASLEMQNDLIHSLKESFYTLLVDVSICASVEDVRSLHGSMYEGGDIQTLLSRIQTPAHELGTQLQIVSGGQACIDAIKTMIAKGDTTDIEKAFEEYTLYLDEVITSHSKGENKEHIIQRIGFEIKTLISSVVREYTEKPELKASGIRHEGYNTPRIPKK